MVIRCSPLNLTRRSVSLSFALCVFQFFLSASVAVFSALAFAPVLAHKVSMLIDKVQARVLQVVT